MSHCPSVEGERRSGKALTTEGKVIGSNSNGGGAAAGGGASQPPVEITTAPQPPLPSLYLLSSESNFIN